MMQSECPSPLPSISASTGMSKDRLRDVSKKLFEVWRSSSSLRKEGNSEYVSIVMSEGGCDRCGRE